MGDYAKGLDTGTIEVAIVGEVDSEYLERLTNRAQEELDRKVRISVFEDEASFRTQGHENVLKLIGEWLPRLQAIYPVSNRENRS